MTRRVTGRGFRLQRERLWVDPEAEAEDVEFEPFLDRDDDTEKAKQRKLKPCPTRRGRDRCATRDEILANRRGRKVEGKLGHVSPDMGNERVGIRTRPGAVFILIGIVRQHPLDHRDRAFCRRAAQLGKDLGSRSEPVPVGFAVVDVDRTAAMECAPADYLVAHVRLSPRGFGGDPRMNRERSAPTEGASAKDLDNCFRGVFGTWRESRTVAIRCAPVTSHVERDAGRHGYRAYEQDGKQE